MQTMNRFPSLLSTKTWRVRRSRSWSDIRKIPVYTAEYDVLVGMTGYALARGMLCAMKRRQLPSVEEICRNTSRIAILENVVNPTNIGAIFRSAAALHMDAVLLTSGMQ